MYIGPFVSAVVIRLFEILKMFYPLEVTLRSTNQWGSFDSLSILLFEKRFWHFQNPNSPSAFFKSWKCFIPRRDVCLQNPVGVQLFLLMFYFGLGKLWRLLNFGIIIRLFETSKMFYPPKGRLPADSSRGPIVFTYILFWVRKRILDFSFQGR